MRGGCLGEVEARAAKVMAVEVVVVVVVVRKGTVKKRRGAREK